MSSITLRRHEHTPSAPGTFIAIRRNVAVGGRPLGSVYEAIDAKLDGTGNLSLGPRPHTLEFVWEVVDGEQDGVTALVANLNVASPSPAARAVIEQSAPAALPGVVVSFS